MADEVKLIDAELLTTNIAQIAKNCARSDAQKALIGRILFMIENMPTIEAEPINNGWISVEDKLPDKSQKVLAFYKALGEKNRIHNDLIATNWRTNKGDFIPCDGYKVTHWQPLPEPPEEEKDETD